MCRDRTKPNSLKAGAAACRAALLTLTLCATAEAYYSGGTGEPNDPFKISNVADWQELMISEAHWDKHFILTADLDMNDVALTPIGEDDNEFKGVFDGNGHIIRNVDMNTPEEDYVGLFGRVGPHVRISNIGLENVDVTGRDCTGGLVGSARYDSDFANCYATGRVSGGSGVGGLIGAGGERITGCYADVSVDASGSAGGLVGSGLVSAVITNCHATGSVSSRYGAAGGLSAGGRTITVIDCYATGSVEGLDDAGGLVGIAGTETQNCYATGAVTGRRRVGGLAGFNVGVMEDCRAEGSVTSNYRAAGGLVGQSDRKAIINCSATGSVAGIDCVGGLLGDNREGSVIDCNASGSVTGVEDVGGVVGRNGEGAVTKCCGTGSIEGMDRVGGLVGYNSGVVNMCYALGPVSSENEGAGGLVGLNDQGGIAMCYATGRVDGHLAKGGLVGVNAGGIVDCYATGFAASGGVVGSSSGGSISGAYFLHPDDGGGRDNRAGEPLTDDQMRQQESFIGWDFVGESANGMSEVWQMPQDSGYPVLSCFNDYVVPILAGAGTPDDPYLISDINEFGPLCHHDSRACYRLTSDIDLIGVEWSMPPMPVCLGVFDGNDHVIGSLDVNMPGGYYVGLFGYLGYKGQVRNITVADAEIVGAGRVGGLVGHKEEVGSITDCNVTGSISGRDYVAGVVGRNHRGVITNCSFTGTVAGRDYVGGILAENWYGAIAGCRATGSAEGRYCVGGLVALSYLSSHQKIVDCCAEVSVTGNDRYAGGLVGSNGGGTIINCHATGSVVGDESVGGFAGGVGGAEVTSCSASGPVSGSMYVGGFAGAGKGKLIKCYAKGSVTGFLIVGGFLGRGANIISECYATGSVAGGNWRVGGLLGWNYEGTVTRCYASGLVSGGDEVGGLIGWNEHGAVSNCYVTASVEGTEYVGGLMGYCNYGGSATNCYSTGPVSGLARVGGLLGENWGGTVTNCYTVSSVEGWHGSAGGLIGLDYQDEGIINGAYYLHPDDGGGPINGKGRPLRDYRMRRRDSFSGWDFVGEIDGTEDIWIICQMADYPKLVWQVPGGRLVCGNGVNGLDFAVLARYWHEADCAALDDCEGADMDLSGGIDFADVAGVSESWLNGLWTVQASSGD